LAYKSDINIDLHIHSTASDGTLTPHEIITMAQDLKLGAIAITDHDTIDGSKQAIDAKIPQPLNFLTGVEISTNPPVSFPCTGSLHMLGYGFRIDDPKLNKSLDMLQEARDNRNPQIIERLNKLGFDITLDEVIKEAGEGLTGRPHIANLMVKKGFVKTFNEVFDMYLGKDKPAYVDKYRADCEQAIAIIKNAGGISVLAHPFLIQLKENKPVEKFVAYLKEMGLQGIEALCPGHTPEMRNQYSEIAKRFDLLITGGSDFHGSLKPDIKMGSGRGNLRVSFELYEKLMDKLNICTSLT